MTPPTTLTLAAVAQSLGVDAPAVDVTLVGVNTLRDATPDELTYFADRKYADEARGTRAGAVLVSDDTKDADVNGRPTLLVPNAAAAADVVLDLFTPEPARPAIGTDDSARLGDDVTLGDGVRIGPNVVVAEGCGIGRNCVLHAGVVLGKNVRLGDDCELFPGVVVRDRCTLGNRVIIHANTVIGTDGFGYRFTPSPAPHHRKIAHVGTVVIEDDVEIGSCTTIDRGKFAQTRIGAGTKIDNLVQIAHNVRIGRLCIVCGCAAIAGSSIIEDGVVLAGGAGIKDHVRVGARSIVGGFSGVMADVPPGQTYVGVPAAPQREFRREQATVRRLPELVQELRDLRRRVATLEEEAGKRPGVAE